MVVWHDLTRFDTGFSARARAKRTTGQKFTFSLPFYAFSPVKFSKNRGAIPRCAPASADRHAGDLQAECVPPGGIKQEKILYILIDATMRAWWGGKAEEEQGERSREQGDPVK